MSIEDIENITPKAVFGIGARRDATIVPEFIKYKPSFADRCLMVIETIAVPISLAILVFVVFYNH